MTDLDDANELRAEAVREMRELGIEHSPDNWENLAVILLRDLRLLTGTAKPGEETVEISKQLSERLHKLVRPAARLVADLRRLDKNYAALKKRGQFDALNHAIAALEAINHHLDGFAISRFGGLPVPLQLVLFGLVNVHESRFDRLLTPPDGSMRLADSARDLTRLTIQGFAADVQRRLIQQWGGKGRGKAAKMVARALDQSGFRKPGRADAAYNARSVQEWLTKAEAGTASFTPQYRYAGEEVQDGSPELLLEIFENDVRSLLFHRN